MRNDFINLMKNKVSSKNRALTEPEISDLRKEALRLTQGFIKSIPLIPGLFLSDYIRTKYGEQIQTRLRKQFTGYDDSDYQTMLDIACNIFDTQFIRDGFVGLAFFRLWKK